MERDQVTFAARFPTLKKIVFSSIMCMYVSVRKSVGQLEEGIRFPGAGVGAEWEPPSRGARPQTWALCESNAHS